jgi:hypothetical protein
MNPLLSAPAVSKMRGSSVLREAMATLLADSTMEQALEALETATRPTSIPPPIPGNHPDTAIAHEFYRMLGVTQAVSALRSLATPLGSHDSENTLEGTEFTHALPEELRMRKGSGL